MNNDIFVSTLQNFIQNNCAEKNAEWNVIASDISKDKLFFIPGNTIQKLCTVLQCRNGLWITLREDILDFDLSPIVQSATRKVTTIYELWGTTECPDFNPIKPPVPSCGVRLFFFKWTSNDNKFSLDNSHGGFRKFTDIEMQKTVKEAFEAFCLISKEFYPEISEV